MRPVGVFAGSLTSAPPIGRDRTGIGRAGSMTQNELGVPICDSGNWETTLEQVLALGFRRGALAQQNLEILARRFGLISGEVETLEAVGNDLGITRERVRQIQTKALTYIERRIDSVKAYGALVSLIQQEIARRGGALGKEEVLALIHLGGQSPRYSPDMGVAFMLWISPLIIKLPRSARNRWTVYGSNDGASQLLTITGRIHEHLRRTGPLERDRLIGEIASDGPDRGIVSTALAVDAATTEIQGYVWLVDAPRWHIVLASLRQLGTPAHFTEIARHVNELLGPNDQTTERAVHGILGNHEPAVFRRVGLGTFGLAEWGLPAAKDSVDLVCQILEREIAWLTAQQIAVKARSAGWRVKPESIRIALDLENHRPQRRVRSVGPLKSTKFGLSWWNDP